MNTVTSLPDDIDLSEIRTLVTDKTFRFTAEKLALKCGVRADLKGFNSLVDAVILYGTDTATSFCRLYAAIGMLRGVKPKTIMREISYALSQAFGLPERLSAMIGVPIAQADIHSGLVIAYLGRLFKRPDLAVYA